MYIKIDIFYFCIIFIGVREIKMANKFEPIYYKIISKPSRFERDYYIKDVLNIHYGAEYTAGVPNMTKDYKGIKKAVLHFAEGAFDTMLWQSMLIWGFNRQHKIYEIQPLDYIFKERCRDGIGLYQCGSHKIKILSPVDLDEMYERALQEFHQNRRAHIEKYSNLDISKIIAAWVHHKQSEYLKNK